jgi:CRISPR/Cas system-associated endonuclease Cas1
MTATKATHWCGRRPGSRRPPCGGVRRPRATPPAFARWTTRIAYRSPAALGIRETYLKRTLGEIERATVIEELLQIEARAASAYFRHFKEIKIRWVKTSRFPVPESWYEMGNRAARSSNKNARHPANAMLSYTLTGSWRATHC